MKSWLHEATQIRLRVPLPAPPKGMELMFLCQEEASREVQLPRANSQSLLWSRCCHKGCWRSPRWQVAIAGPGLLIPAISTSEEEQPATWPRQLCVSAPKWMQPPSGGCLQRLLWRCVVFESSLHAQQLTSKSCNRIKQHSDQSSFPFLCVDATGRSWQVPPPLVSFFSTRFICLQHLVPVHICLANVAGTSIALGVRFHPHIFWPALISEPLSLPVPDNVH